MGVGEAVEGGCASRWGGSSGRHYIIARISRVRVVTQEQEAFAKARKALAEKRAQKKEEKAINRRRRPHTRTRRSCPENAPKRPFALSNRPKTASDNIHDIKTTTREYLTHFHLF